MPRDVTFVLDMLIAARHVVAFVANVDRDTFVTDVKAQSAVLWQIVLIGEAARRVSSEFRTAHPEVEWQAIIGMRSKLVHEYDQIDVVEVWKVVQVDVPVLIRQISPLIPPPDEAGV